MHFGLRIIHIKVILNEISLRFTAALLKVAYTFLDRDRTHRREKPGLARTVALSQRATSSATVAKSSPMLTDTTEIASTTHAGKLH